MNRNSEIIIDLCSRLCVGDNVVPFSNREWSDLACTLREKKMEPKDLLSLKDEEFNDILCFDQEKISRIKDLIARAGSLTFEIEKLNSIGINIVTRADELYPKILKKKLGTACPPLFYYAGNLRLFNEKCVGFVGSRNISDDDIEFTKKLVYIMFKKGYYIVSGGAKGVDRTSTEMILSLGGSSIEFLSDSLLKRIKDVEVNKAIRDDRMCLLSTAVPSTGFDVGLAMERNKYIYCSSDFTVVVKSDYKKGGTWFGATEAIKKKYTQIYCRKKPEYIGNKNLIELGAGYIDGNYEFNRGINIDDSSTTREKVMSKNDVIYYQPSIFDFDDEKY